MSPSAPDDHMRSMSAGSSASTAFPLPSVFIRFRAAFSASREFLVSQNAVQLSQITCEMSVKASLKRCEGIGFVECTVLLAVTKK